MARRGGEGWILVVLLGVFIVAAVYYGERGFQSQQTDQPTTYSVNPAGARALYQLYERRGLRVRRFERPLTHLPPGRALLVVIEPLQRPVGKAESDALWAWVAKGGSLLLIVSSTWSDRAKSELQLDDIRVVNGSGQPDGMQLSALDEPLLRDVQDLRFGTRTRLKDDDGSGDHTVLASDASGAAAIAWTQEGGGSVAVVSDALGPANARLADADNALLFVNAADVMTGPGKTVLFDEYHQGFGSESAEGRSLWDALGAPARAVFWYLAVVLAIVIYNANRRFGVAQELRPPSSRPSTDYISSMAGLFRRAEAPEIALETIYRTFVRDLAVRIEAPPDAGSAELIDLAVQRLGWERGSLAGVVKRCEAVIAGERVPEADALKLARQIQAWRRGADLDKLAAAPGAPSRTGPHVT